MRITTFFAVFVVLAIIRPAGADELSPDFRAAAQVAYNLVVTQEKTVRCKEITTEQREAITAARKKAASLKRSEADKALMSLIYSYVIGVNAWQGGVIGFAKESNPDCTPRDEFVALFAQCRAAIDEALKGGAIAPKSVCQPPQ